MKTGRRLVLVGWLSLCFALGSPAADLTNQWAIFILAGQSNMGGTGGEPDQLPASLQKEQANVFLYQTKYLENGLPVEQWTPLKPGTFFGPEIGFGAEMAKRYPKHKIGLIKVCGGGPITGWVGNNGQGIQDAVEKATKGRKAEIMGLLWMQGEADAGIEELAKQYKKNLIALIGMVRKTLAKPALPFLIGRISPRDTPFKYADLVRKAELSVSLEEPYTALVITDDLETPDRLHFDGKGQLELGRRFAKALEDAKKPKKPADK